MKEKEARPLSQLLVPELDEVEVIDVEEYRIAGIYGFGRGVFARGPIRGSETSYRKLQRLHAGRLVMSRLKAFEGAIAVVPEALDGWFVSSEFPTLRCVEGELDQQYLAHVCRWPDFWSMLAASSKGIGARRERVHVDDLLRIELRVPPIEQQRAIAARIDRLTALVAAGIEHRAARSDPGLRALTDSLLPAAALRLRERCADQAALGVLGEWSSGGTPEAKRAEYYDGDVPWAVIGDLNDGVVDVTTRAISALGLANSSAKVVPAGSVLVAMYGSIGKLGIAGVDMATNQAIAACRPNRGRVSADFLFRYLRCIRSDLVELGQGGAQQNISQTLLKEVVIPVPPESDQEDFVSEVDRLVRYRQQADVLCSHRRALTSSLILSALNEGFAGLS